MINTAEDINKILEDESITIGLAIHSTYKRVFDALERNDKVQELLNELLSKDCTGAAFWLGYKHREYIIEAKKEKELFCTKTYPLCTVLYLLYKTAVAENTGWDFNKNSGYIKYTVSLGLHHKSLFGVKLFGNHLLAKLDSRKKEI